MAASESDARSRHFGRSASGSRRLSSRSNSNSPFKSNGTGLLTVLRQKLTARVSRTRESGDTEVVAPCRQTSADVPAASATLCSSWRSRPRHIDKPIRPAYSDENLSCCGRRSNCLRGRVHQHRTHANEELSVFDVDRSKTSNRKSAGLVICKHCHSKNDQSPSDIELSEQEVSHLDDGKVRGLLPVDKEYGHAVAPNTCSVTLSSDTLTVHVSGRECSVLRSVDAGASCSTASTSSAEVLVTDSGGASLNIESLQVVPPTQPFYDQVKEAGPKGWSLSKELFRLSKYGWYWGPISRVEAEEKLTGQPDGAFLVRDSSDDHYLLSLSFRSYGRTLHTRIEHCNGVFSFYAQPESEGYSSIVDLIEHSMTDSQSGVFCYSRARMPGSPSFPVRLARPVSRFAQVRTLQYLCRFCIRQYTRVDHIQQLPLPTSIKGWLEEGQY